ncbi:MAG: von Willebrand factor type A domain-containing protein [Ruminococcus sp.]|nr:von Willebrand factor type A domain-containing protein [Ruminococcus sp.]
MKNKRNLLKMLSALIAPAMLTACGSSDKASGSAEYYEAPRDYGTVAVNSSPNDGYEINADDEAPAATQSIFQGISPGEVNESPVLEASPAFDGMSPAEVNESPAYDEEYNYIEENGYTAVSSAPLSTFSADVDTASYTNVRRMIYDGSYIPPDAVRLEEFINYFNYNYDDPADNEPFAVHTELSDCPWNSDTQLFMAGINTKSIDNVLEERPPMNLVFLIDVSGSMYSDDKLPLVQKSFSMLTDNLTSADRISIVTYAGSDEVVLEGADGNDREEILNAVNRLQAGGSTAGAAGISTAYDIAEKYFIDGGNNRIILATDGDLNVGVSSESGLTRLIEEKREKGVFLSVLGFGTGNYKDNRLEALADNGNGNYSYIDSEREAQRVLVDEMSGTLFTVAKDVKFQLEFNPANVKGYRLIGYENRKMAAEDFNDDTKDAGEIGAGHSVTVLYEIVPADSSMEIGESALKYSGETSPMLENELLTVNIRYKDPDGSESRLISVPVDKSLYSPKMSENMTLASCAAQFGMLLRGSQYIGDVTYSSVASQMSAYDYSSDEFKDELLYLINTVKRRAN